MAATVTNLTQANALGGNTFTLAAIAGAGGAINSGNNTSVNGIDNANSCQFLESNGGTTTANTHYSAYISIASAGSGYDISSASQALIVHFAQQNLSFNTYTSASDSLWLIACSGGNLTDYARWEMNIQDVIDGQFHKLPLTGTPDTTGGSWDDTDVTHFGIAAETNTTGTNFGMAFLVDQLIHVDGQAVYEDTGGAAQLAFEDYYDVLYPLSGTTYHSKLNAEIKPAWAFGHGVLVEADDFSDSSFTFIFLPNDATLGFVVSTTAYYSLGFVPDLATATLAFTDGVFAYASGSYALTVDGSTLTSGTMTFTRCSFLNTGAVAISGAQTTMASCTISSPASVDISDGDLDVQITNSTAAIQWTGDLVAGSTITTDSDIDITFAETDLSDINVVFTTVATVSVDPTTGSGTYNLSGVSSSNVVKLWNKDTANATTISIGSSISTQKVDLWFNYDNEASGPFTEGETLTFANGATATLITLVDNGATGTMYCTYIAGATPPDNNGITGGTSSATADVDEATGANKSTLTISAPADSYTLQLPNIINSSRFQVYNVTSATELTNSTTSGGTGIDQTYTEGTDYTAGDSGRYRITYQSTTTAKDAIEGTFTFPSTTATNSIPTTQINQATYNSHAVDGSAVTGISWDSGNLEFDFNEVDDVIDGQDIGAWYYYYITTATGIDEAFGAFNWPQVNKLENVTGNVGVEFDNVSADALKIINCWISRDDGATIIAATSNSIQIDPPAVFAIETGVSGLTPTESTQLGVIDTVSTNVSALNDITVDEIWDESIAGHTAIATMGWYNTVSGSILVDTTATGTPTSTQMQLTAGSSSDDFYNDQALYIAGGAGIGQVRPISSYEGATRTITIDEPFVITPGSGDRVLVQAIHVHPISQIQDGLATNADMTEIKQDLGLDASNPKTITEITEGESYDETVDTITKEVRKSGSTTTITRTS